MEVICRQCASVWDVGDSLYMAETVEAIHFETTGHSDIGRRRIREQTKE